MNSYFRPALFFMMTVLFAGCAANPLIYSVSPQFEKVFMTESEDGWTLAVHHYPPEGIPKNKPPVILCHGLNQNYLFWDLTPKWSFAQYLSQAGFDVWSVSLRGSGKSTKPGWAQFLELNQLRSDLLDVNQYDYRKFNWNLDDFIRKDVPILIRFVQEQSGRKKLTWIGHSMGGMILYGYLGIEHDHDPGIVNAVLIGAPGEIAHPASELFQVIVTREALLRMALLLNTKNVSVFNAPFAHRLHGPLQILNYNEENMSKDVLARFNAHVVENSSPGVITQLKKVVEAGDFVSVDGKTNYSQNIPNLHVNLLCIAGKLDNMALPGSVLKIYHEARSSDKTYRLFGVANGYSVDYGHNDLILGKKAPEEVYPYILSWLDRH